MSTTASKPVYDFSHLQCVALDKHDTLNMAQHGAELIPGRAPWTPEPINMFDGGLYEWHQNVRDLGAYFATERVRDKNSSLSWFQLSLHPDLLNHARVLVNEYAEHEEEQQLPSVVFGKAEKNLIYNVRGNEYPGAKVFLAPLNKEGVDVVVFPHPPFVPIPAAGGGGDGDGEGASDVWLSTLSDHGTTSYNLGPELALYLRQQANKYTIHVPYGRVLSLDKSMPFYFDKQKIANYQVHCVTYEKPGVQQRRTATWTSFIEAKGLFDVEGKFKMPQMKASLITINKKKEEVEAIAAASAAAMATVDSTKWLTSKDAIKPLKQTKAKEQHAKAAAFVDALEASHFHERAAKLLPGSLKPAIMKLLESGKRNFNSVETKKLSKQIKEAEDGQETVARATVRMNELNEVVPDLFAPEDKTKVNGSIVSIKKELAELQKKLEDGCLLEKANQIDKLHERVQKVMAQLSASAAGGGAKKRSKSSAAAGAAAGAAVVLEGDALAEFIEKVGNSLASTPNPVLQVAFDDMISTMSKMNESGQKLAYNVSKIQSILEPPPPAQRGAGGHSKPAIAGAGAPAIAKCHRKSGGCGKSVSSLYADQDICLSCFLVYLKEKSQEVIKTMDESDPLYDALANEYERVYPDMPSKKQVDPAALFDLVKQISQDDNVIPMEIDLNSNSGNQDEDDGEDLDEEDDSIVVDDDEVSYASSDSDLDDDDEDDEEEEEEVYERGKNRHGKRERAADAGASAGVPAALHTIAHRILLARERTPIEARISELYELHRKATLSADASAAQKLIAAAEVELDKLDALKKVYIIHATIGTKSMITPFCFYSEDEAEAKCALLEKQTPGLKGRVEEKTLGA